NFFRQGWIACRIRDQLRTAFDGVDPVVMTTSLLHDADEFIRQDMFDPYGFTLFFAGNREVIDPLRAAFADPRVRYWYPWQTGAPQDSKGRFSVERPPEPPPFVSEKLLFAGQPLKPEWYGLRVATV